MRQCEVTDLSALEKRLDAKPKYSIGNEMKTSLTSARIYELWELATESHSSLSQRVPAFARMLEQELPSRREDGTWRSDVVNGPVLTCKKSAVKPESKDSTVEEVFRRLESGLLSTVFSLINHAGVSLDASDVVERSLQLQGHLPLESVVGGEVKISLYSADGDVVLGLETETESKVKTVLSIVLGSGSFEDPYHAAIKNWDVEGAVQW